MKKTEVKLLAVIGGSAVVTLGVLGASLGQDRGNESSLAGSGAGTTATVSHAPTAPPTPVATPAIKGPAPLPPEEQGLPG
jgi:hypothetical protein